MRSILSALARYSAVVALAACASSSGGSPPAQGTPDRLSQSEIAASNATSAYELITRLRPQWLRRPATGSISGGSPRNQAILIYLDRQRLPDMNSLKSLSIAGIISAQWIDATRAPTILPDVPQTPIAGAIVLKTR